MLTRDPHHYVVTVDSATSRMVLYVDGLAVGNGSLTNADGVRRTLGDVRDLDNWLGRSQYLADAFFLGSFDEFRIYAAALDADQVLLAFEAGPDVVPSLEPSP